MRNIKNKKRVNSGVKEFPRVLILDMEVVAEGVEHEHQMKTLKEYGCDIIQGYYYSKPLSVHNFEEYIIKKGEI